MTANRSKLEKQRKYEKGKVRDGNLRTNTPFITEIDYHKLEMLQFLFSNFSKKAMLKEGQCISGGGGDTRALVWGGGG
jgi:hypothetical protein